MEMPHRSDIPVGTYTTTKWASLDFFPYQPNIPERWAAMASLFAAAAAVNPEAKGFIGWRDEKDGRHFYFQERGNPEVVVVVALPQTS
jgi:hypothetical protein